jgi:hypothetical protein
MNQSGALEEPSTQRNGARVLFWLVLLGAVVYVLIR